MLTFVSSTPRWLISSFWRFVKVLLQALGSATRATLISLERKRDMWPNLVSILFHSKPFFITCKVYLGPFVKHFKNNTFIFETKFWVLKKLFFLLWGATSRWNVEFHQAKKIMFVHKFWMLTLTYWGVQSFHSNGYQNDGLLMSWSLGTTLVEVWAFKKCDHGQRLEKKTTISCHRCDSK